MKITLLLLQSHNLCMGCRRCVKGSLLLSPSVCDLLLSLSLLLCSLLCTRRRLERRLLGGGQILCVELSPPLFIMLQDARPQRLLSFRLRLECLLSI